MTVRTVWILQTGEPLPTDSTGSRAMRAVSLTQALIDAGHRVVLWSADFNHSEHHHRYGGRTRIKVSEQLEIRLLSSRGYDDNLGLGRVLDHAQLGMDLRRVLAREQPPDAAFVGFPPIETAAYMSHWLTRHDVPFFIDVKDAWPDIFARALPERIRPLGEAALAPYYAVTRRCLRQATALSSISDDFLEWSARRAGRDVGPLDRVTPLTAPPPSSAAGSPVDASFWDELGVPDDGRFRVSFVGTLHSSYDWEPVAQAARTTGVQLVIGGDGSRADGVRSLMAGLDNVVMPGWLTSSQADVLARRSSVALAPIAAHPDYMMSVPNKFYDAWSKGLPVVTGLPGTAARVISEQGVGASYGAQTNESLAEVLARLQRDPVALKEMGSRAESLYRRDYDHATVYRALADAVVSLPDRCFAGRSG